MKEIMDHLQETHMVFITAGMGGGTGTGAAPVIARLAREAGILTVGVVTKPFQFEGTRRMRSAEKGIEELQKYVDTLIIIPNQNLFCIANEKTTFAQAFQIADNVLAQGVKGITDLMINPGLINLDFADVKTVMHEMGKAVMGTGEAEGENRAVKAAQIAISNPLLEDITLKGSKGVLISISGGMDMTLHEVDDAAKTIREEVDQDANIIFGTTLDPELKGSIRVSLIATGMDMDISTINQRNTTAIDAIGRPSTAPNAPTTSETQETASNTQTPYQNNDDFFTMPDPVVAQSSLNNAKIATSEERDQVEYGFDENSILNLSREDDYKEPKYPYQESVPKEERPSLLQRMVGKKSTPKQKPDEAKVTPSARTTMLAPEPKLKQSSSDQEDLDIPAFLRRQAN